MIIAKTKEFGADLAGVVNLKDLRNAPSYVISPKLPAFEGEGTMPLDGRRRGIVKWPDDARSAVVVAVSHPPAKPELDWWIIGATSAYSAGDLLLMEVVARMAGWLERKHGIRCFKLPYHIERGGVYMKDAAVLAGLGCSGENNLLVTPRYGPRLRLRVMLTSAELPSTGVVDFDPCSACPAPCRKACPWDAFAEKSENPKTWDA